METEESLLREDVGTTVYRLRTLARAVSSYDSTYGQLPTSLDLSMASFLGDEAYKRLTLDAWNRAIRYQPGDLVIVLRSAGSDGRFDTADEIVVSVNRFAHDDESYDP